MGVPRGLIRVRGLLRPGRRITEHGREPLRTDLAAAELLHQSRLDLLEYVLE